MLTGFKLKPGFTVVEFLVVLVIFSVIMVLTLPGILAKANANKGMMAAKSVASAIVEGGSKLSQAQEDIGPTSPTYLNELGNYIKSTEKFATCPNNSLSPLPLGGTPSQATNTWCIQLQGGAYLLPLTAAPGYTLVGGEEVAFQLDPDGEGQKQSMVLIYNTRLQRVIPLGAALATPNGCQDPDYVSDWTKLDCAS
jgi:prepilin-type N-terminal cleavage/methylation domain-containing protein